MRLTVHPKAAERSTEIGNELLERASSDAPQESRSDLTYQPDLPISGTLGRDQIIGPIIRSQEDRFGNEIACYYDDDIGTIALTNEAHSLFLKACRTLHGQPSVRAVVSESTVRRLVFEWICKTKRGAASRAMPEYVLQESERLLQDCVVVIPIHGLHVEAPFALGRVTFADLASTEMAKWRQLSLKQAPDHATEVNEMHDRLRKTYQGRAAAFYRVHADPDYATHRAREEAELSVAVLRLFSIGAFAPERATTVAVAGQEAVLKGTYMLLSPDGFSMSDYFLHPQEMRPFTLDRTRIQTDLPVIAGHWSVLLKKEHRTQFEDVALRSMLLYSRATQYRNIAEKLIHIFSAIESLFLKNDNEPIAASVSDRRAFAVGSDSEARQAVARAFRHVYSLRSKYVHHAIADAPDSGDLASLEQFLVSVSQLFINLRIAMQRHQTRDDFIAELEARKYA